MGFTGVYIIFLISAQNIDCGYSLEPPRRGGSNEYPQSMFLSRNKKKSDFLSEHFHFFFVVKFSVYLNRFVFVMISENLSTFLPEMMKRFTFQAISNATFSVDTFFVLR